MAEEIEIESLVLRYEGYRVKNSAREGKLLASIARRGILEPLEGADGAGERILLNGFKRYRSARKLGLGTVPYRRLGDDETGAIVTLLRRARDHTLTILEEARFVEELGSSRKLSLAEISELLSRSKGWVSMRLGLLEEMSEKIRERILGGDFPSYSYMYSLRKFMRMNAAGKKDAEAFVEAVSGKSLSTRDLDSLARAYFRGGELLREEIVGGNFAAVLERFEELKEDHDGASDFERRVLRSLELMGSSGRRFVAQHRDERLTSSAFFAEANLLTAGVLSALPALKKAMEELHDRSANASRGVSSPRGGSEREEDRTGSSSRP